MKSYFLLFYFFALASGFARRAFKDDYPMVYILLEGYYRPSGGADAPDSVRMSSTVTLITVANKSIVVDTGASNQGYKLQQMLPERYGIKLNEVNLLIITHTHPDHYENALGFYPVDRLIHKQIIKKDEFIGR